MEASEWVSLHILLPEDLKRQIGKVASKRGITRGELLRELIAQATSTHSESEGTQNTRLLRPRRAKNLKLELTSRELEELRRQASSTNPSAVKYITAYLRSRLLAETPTSAQIHALAPPLRELREIGRRLDSLERLGKEQMLWPAELLAQLSATLRRIDKLHDEIRVAVKLD